MQQETRNCQSCEKDFIIDSDDFAFYEKIKVPAPTFCPECRMQRRFASSNERFFYYRKSDLTGEKMLSMYPADAPFPVYRTDEWYSDAWDPYQYGMDYDFTKSFFDQFKELQKKVPRMALVKQGESVNSEYTHRVHDMKNSYMVLRATRSEDSLYTYIAKDIKNCSDCFAVSQCELCYECIDCDRCYKVRFSQESSDCRDSFFLYACRNSSNCVGCVNLINQEYCIFNKKYTKEEYAKELENLKLNTTEGIEKLAAEFEEFRKKFPQRAVTSIKSTNASGNWLRNSENTKNSFWCHDVKDGRYLNYIFSAQDCMDYFQWGGKAELVYESENCGINVSRLYFCSQCWMGAHDLYYCDSCPGASFCFGCIGVKKGEYAILNKKYTKEEYEALVPKIIEQMKTVAYIDKLGREYRFGEHFPDELSVFAYNESAAIDFYPIPKEEAVERGYTWKDRENKNYTATIQSTDLPQTITENNDTILNEVIGCAEKDKPYSTGVYRITSNELQFYRKMDLPLPRVCFDVRHTKRLQKRPPSDIIKRMCSKCSREVETVYSESYAPILYCEQCYQQEVA